MTIARTERRVARRAVDDDDYYPTGDGKPMAETEKHRRLMVYCIELLDDRYWDRPDVQVSGNNFVYWQEGNRKAVVSPDCYVVFGVEKKLRDSYMVWRENGIVPAFVLEVTSKSTKHVDTARKRPRYEQALGIPEYFLFDPTGDYLEPRLQGFRLVEGRYVEIAPEFSRLQAPVSGLRTARKRKPRLDVRLHSEQLGLDLESNGDQLYFYDTSTGARLLSAVEKLQIEADARNFAERRADTEWHRAEAERQRAEIERQRADHLEAELQRLRAELQVQSQPIKDAERESGPESA